MYFSIQNQGFYVGDNLDKSIMPLDCVEVSAALESNIRSTIISGVVVTAINGDNVTTEQITIGKESAAS